MQCYPHLEYAPYLSSSPRHPHQRPYLELISCKIRHQANKLPHTTLCLSHPLARPLCVPLGRICFKSCLYEWLSLIKDDEFQARLWAIPLFPFSIHSIGIIKRKPASEVFIVCGSFLKTTFDIVFRQVERIERGYIIVL